MPLVRARSKLARTLVLLTIIASVSSVTSAQAVQEAGRADPGLSANVGFGGTGDRVKTVRTDLLRNAVPGDAARILLIGTGVERALFPTSLGIGGVGRDLTDPHGYGTLAASAIFQLLPQAHITSKAVRAHDAAYTMLRMDDLRDALVFANANRRVFDAVLLAYPPQAALDPIAYVAGHGDYRPFGTGLDLIAEALLTNPNGIHGIPADDDLREQAFAGVNLKQRDAIEKYARQARAWNAVLDVLADLDAAGVPVVAPAGDYTLGNASNPTPLPNQTIFGLSAEESVITVGASYADAGTERVSPTSGRGPTLSLDAKPDLVAPSDVLGMLPAGANLSWPDDSLRAPLSLLRWAKPGTPPTACPSVDGAYRCVLQGSSLVSAAVVTANLAASVASGIPSVRQDRGATDDEILRGLAWAHASKTDARASTGGSFASLWEQGTGVFAGLKGLDPSTTPVALARPHLGEVSFTKDAVRSIPLWSGGAPVAGSAVITSLTGPRPDGATVVAPHTDRQRVRVTGSGYGLDVRALAGRHQGGIYGGSLTLTPAGGPSVDLPLTVTQTLPIDFKASYAYNELLARGEGERVEDASLLLFAGLPTNVGLIGAAFKNLTGSAFKNAGGDPTNNYILRVGRTRNSFREDVAPSEHGTGRIGSVPPGFYKFHLLADHGFDARQERGREESIGIRLGSFGPDTALVPGASLLVPSQPACDGAGGFGGPFNGCLRADDSVDPATGFCTARNDSTRVAFNVYCAPIAFAMPGAVASRAVHLIEHDRLPARSEWATCGLDVPADGRRMDFAALAEQAGDCSGANTVGTAWRFDAGAPGCLSPSERAAYPNGHPNDLVASYTAAAAPGVPGRNFPVAVLQYRFELPQPNTYTTASLSLSYVADDAIIGTRFVTGTNRLADSANGVLVVDDPDVAVAPALKRPASAGSAFTEWAVMSANATHGTLTLFIIPTSWVNTSLNPTAPIARVQLCDVALRVNTFAKQSFGAERNGLQTSAFTDRALLDQIDPAVSRVRPVHDGRSFTAAGVERESLTIAVHVPKDTTRRASEHRVLSPVGGPAYLSGTRAASGGAVGGGLPAYDPGFGIRHIDCGENPDLANLDVDRARNGAVCRAFNRARASGEVVAEVTPDVMVNGRFYGVLAFDRTALSRAAGDVLVDVAPADDGGAFETRWARRGGSLERLFPVSDFYDDAVPLPLSPLAGVLSVARDARGKPVLTVDAAEPGGAAYRITSLLE